MNTDEQKYTIETLLSSVDVFSRCIGIIDAEYFDPEYRPSVRYVKEYFEKYHNIPSAKALNAKFPEHGYEYREYVPTSEQQSTCDEIELFCKRQALFNAIENAVPKVLGKDTKAFESILQEVQDALNISLERDIGIDMFDCPEARMQSLVDSQIYEPTGIDGIDKPLGGGLARKQVTLFSANSGGGKSIMMANIGANYAKRGYRVLLLSLELSEEMIFLRNTAIMSGFKAMEWKENIPNIAKKLDEQSKNGGSFLIKRIPNGSSANDIRAYLKHYELTFKAKPDVIIVDYLDLLSPNGGVGKSMGVSEQDKLKSEQLAEVAYVYNAIMISASQQNRDAIRMGQPDQGVIAGGITKVNTVDNYISIYMDAAMRLQGDMIIYFLKTRSSSAVGSSQQLKFNADNLQIVDIGGQSVRDAMAIKSKKKVVEPKKLEFPGESSADDTGENFNSEDLVEGLVSYDDEPTTQRKKPRVEDVSNNSADTPPWDTDEVSLPKPAKKKTGLKLNGGKDGIESLMESLGITHV